MRSGRIVQRTQGTSGERLRRRALRQAVARPAVGRGRKVSSGGGPRIGGEVAGQASAARRRRLTGVEHLTDKAEQFLVLERFVEESHPRHLPEVFVGIMNAT